MPRRTDSDHAECSLFKQIKMYHINVKFHLSVCYAATSVADFVSTDGSADVVVVVIIVPGMCKVPSW